MRLLGTKQIQTTAYHPIANGLVKRFHWQLKGTLKYLLDSTQWTTALPLIFLGIRTTLKQDLKFTTAEMVYAVVHFTSMHFTSIRTVDGICSMQ